MNVPYHIPVLLGPCIEGLDIKPAGTYCDVTMGGGGHSRGILQKLGPQGRLLGFDQDADAIANAPDDERFTFIRSNFRYLSNWLRYYQVEALDGLLADLGVSSHHFDEAERGFSFRQEGPLDMRMNQQATKSAADVINTYDKRTLMPSTGHAAVTPSRPRSDSSKPWSHCSASRERRRTWPRYFRRSASRSTTSSTPSSRCYRPPFWPSGQEDASSCSPTTLSRTASSKISYAVAMRAV